MSRDKPMSKMHRGLSVKEKIWMWILRRGPGGRLLTILSWVFYPLKYAQRAIANRGYDPISDTWRINEVNVAGDLIRNLTKLSEKGTLFKLVGREEMVEEWGKDIQVRMICLPGDIKQLVKEYQDDPSKIDDLVHKYGMYVYSFMPLRKVMEMEKDAITET